MAALGLYLHIPFCAAKCRYCDFCSAPAGEGVRAAYVGALCREMAAHGQGQAVDTVFIGGGTPSLLSEAELKKLCDTVKTHFSLTHDCEWTAEANPGTVDLAKLTAMREAGINRLSLGVQSAHEKELCELGRIHRMPDVCRAVEDARAAGFCNINLDIMFGIPHSTRASFAATLDAALSLGPEHLSVYSLQIEEGTPFWEERNSLPLPDEESECAMQTDLLAKLRGAGYRRYEISNYAKPGYECWHNLRYWQMRDYLGFGVAAHSLYDGMRFYNREDIGAYIANPCGVRETEETVSEQTAEYETVMLGLRLASGLNENTFKSRFGYGFFEKYKERLAPFLAAGYAVRVGDFTRLTDTGMAVQNTILAKILD